MLVDLHGQHAHQSLVTADAQRTLVDAFGGFTTLARETASAWREWRAAVERRDAAAAAREATAAERDALDERRRELAALAFSADEWASPRSRSAPAHAAALIETAEAVEHALAEDDDALARRLATLVARLEAGAIHDPRSRASPHCSSPRISSSPRPRASFAYRRKLDVDPAELARIERQAAFHAAARKHRVRPERCPRSWPRPKRSSRRTRSRRTSTRSRNAPRLPSPHGANSPANSRRSGASPRTSWRAASRRRWASWR
jgi:DNA repair protein RecN (Recombination protein N)